MGSMTFSGGIGNGYFITNRIKEYDPYSGDLVKDTTHEYRFKTGSPNLAILYVYGNSNVLNLVSFSDISEETGEYVENTINHITGETREFFASSTRWKSFKSNNNYGKTKECALKEPCKTNQGFTTGTSKDEVTARGLENYNKRSGGNALIDFGVSEININVDIIPEGNKEKTVEFSNICVDKSVVLSNQYLPQTYDVDIKKAFIDGEDLHFTEASDDRGTYYHCSEQVGNDYELAIAYALFIGTLPSKNNFHFDVYLDGKTESNIGITWNKVSADGSFSGQLTRPHFYFFPNRNGLLPGYPENCYPCVNEDFLMCNDNSKSIQPLAINDVAYSHLRVDFDDAKYETSYISKREQAFSGYSKIQRVFYQGIQGDEDITLLLRLDVFSNNDNAYGHTGYCKVIIPKKLPDSADNIVCYAIKTGEYFKDMEVQTTDASYIIGDWDLTCTVHFGDNPDNNDPRKPPSSDSKTDDDKGKYDPDDPTDPSEFENGVSTETSGILTKTYAMTVDRLKTLGAKLWTQSYFDVLKIQNNPIENIVSVKAFPFSISGTEKTVKIGDVDMGVNGLSCSSNLKLNIGEIHVQEKYNSFLDYNGFTNLTIFLPYIGFRDLDCSQIMNTILKVEYVVDFITGACKAIIYSDNICIYEFDGTMGIDIPLTSSDRAQTDLKHLQSLASGVGSIASKNISGAVNSMLTGAQAQYTSQSTSSGSPSCSSFSSRNIFLIYDRPLYTESKGLNETKGRICNQKTSIKDLKGFTILDANINLNDISGSLEEKEEFKTILSNGFFA